MQKLRSRALKPEGFTLIELLVVIAIIGILSAVVLASLNTARSKGSDAAIQSDLDGIRTEAELYYSKNGNSYSDFCTANQDTTIDKQRANAQTSNGGTATTCKTSATAYVVSSPLVGATGKFWCVDSTGISQQQAAGGDTTNIHC